ncbi:MAG: DUF2867 domain-containing protein [Solirubrobacteraceae bacterium]
MDSRLPPSEHLSRPWRIQAIAHGFRLEDVWALPVEGSAGDLDAAVEMIGSFDPTQSDSLPSRALWALRDLLGRLGLGRISDSADERPRGSLAGRLPADLVGTAEDIRFGRLPFVPLYRTDDEFAAEIANSTMHGVLHLAWAERSPGRFQGQMAVYVKPHGRFGEAYMAAIRPFRHRVVYPALMRQIEQAWAQRRPT